MSSINNAGQQPRLCIDLNVEYRAEDGDALNGDRVRESGTPSAETHEAGRRISQIHVISDSAQTSFSMRHSAPQAQTSLRAPRDQGIDAGKMVVSIENANQRISVTSSLPSASPVPKHLRKPGETDETRITKKALSKRELVLVPEALRLEGETDQTRISSGALSQRKNAEARCPVPKDLRKPGETDETRISKKTLSKRQLVLVSEALRLEGETDQTRISSTALSQRRNTETKYPVPKDLRKSGETDDTRIRYTALKYRKMLVLVPKSLREPGETENTKIARFILQNRKRKREAEQSSAGIKKSK